jgi:peptide-methionine (S)-S-oxide reductase
LGACLALTSAACGTDGGTSMKPSVSHSGQDAAQQQLPALDLSVPSNFQTAAFAYGWFWGTEAQFGAVPGVIRTRVGYAGGTTPDPTYYNLGGAAETVQLDFDPTQVSYEEFSFHDATSAPSTGQYRSLIFVNGPEQEAIARSVLERVQAESEGTIKTQIVTSGDFTLAEDYHQKYALQGNSSLFKDLSAVYPNIWDLVNSTAAMRVNAYLDGFGTQAQLQAELGELGLSDAGQQHLLAASPAAACPVP